MRRGIQVFEWLIFVGLVLLVAFGVRAWGVEANQIALVTATPTLTQPPSPSPTATVPPTWTPTATPSPPPTETPRPTLTPEPSPTLTPQPVPDSPHPPPRPPVLTDPGVVEADLPQPTPMPRISQPEGTINVLALGMDRQGGTGIARTDVMMIVSIYPDIPAASLISIPRDYYAWIPTWGLDKINTAFLRGARTGYPGGGPGMVKATIEYNFGLPIHYYALVDFNSYRSIVDAVGGVDVVVECPFHDTYPDPEVPEGQTDIDMEPGVHHLNGKYALWYVRSRWNTSDFDRHRRQQQVMRAILAQALNKNMITRIPEFWGVYKESVDTDMTLPDLVYLGSVGTRLDTDNLKSRFIRGSHLLTSMTAPNGGSVLAPNHENLRDFMWEAAQPPLTSRAQQRAYRVEVLNGAYEGWGHVAAYQLGLEGFEVVSVEATEGTARTAVVDFTTTSKGSRLPELRNFLRLQPDDVIAQPTEGSEVDFRVIVGWNFNPCHATRTATWRPTPTPRPTPERPEPPNEP